MYDTIARRTQRQSQLLSQTAEKARLSKDAAFREDCCGRIAVLGAYIKRYANLTLLSQDKSEIEAGELGLSASEVLRYLNFRGIPGECFFDVAGSLRADAALAVYEAFGTLLEDEDGSLKGVFVNLSERERTAFKMTLENYTAPLPCGMLDRLSAFGVRTDVTQEDQVTYLCFTFLKGGEAV